MDRTLAEDPVEIVWTWPGRGYPEKRRCGNGLSAVFFGMSDGDVTISPTQLFPSPPQGREPEDPPSSHATIGSEFTSMDERCQGQAQSPPRVFPGHVCHSVNVSPLRVMVDSEFASLPLCG